MTGPVKPFLKWAGGKRWLIQKYAHLLPPEFGRYIEPFLGSGAVFFHLQPKAAVLSDSNAALISCYRALQSNHKKVNNTLSRLSEQHSDEFYYEMRSTKSSCQYKEAARFIYLNRTCFNGLYRVNLNGEFNVPRGTKDSVIFPDDDFAAVARCLEDVTLSAGDFEVVVDAAGVDDFVFVDPPYTVRHNMNGFVKYNQRIFSWDDQIRLCNAVRRAKKRGVKCLITNADHESVSGLYKNVGEVTRAQRASVVGGKATARGHYTELAIRVNY